MKHFVLEVNSPQSYVRFTGPFGTKPNLAIPFDVPLDPGGYLELAVDEKKHSIAGQATHLKFTTDKLAANPGSYITGAMQQISVKFSGLGLDYVPATGEIHSGGCYLYLHGEPTAGGLGALATWYLGPSKLIDTTGPSFNLTDGLGFGGGCILEVGSGNPTDFIVHLNTTVQLEDLDGDGNYEGWYPSIWKKIKPRVFGPKMEIDWPRPLPSVAGVPGERYVHPIPLSTLLEMTRHGDADSGKHLTQLQIHNAAHLGALLYDRTGKVHLGDMSDHDDKLLQLTAGDFSNLTLGIVVTRAD